MSGEDAQDEPPIAIESVSHWYGEGSLRRQVLSEVSAVIRAGEIVILSGPSGSGKTTLLTLIGALRSTQEGSLRVLGHELRDADEQELTAVRRQIGYVFQAHNLLDALTARQNVEMGLQLHAGIGTAERTRRAEELLHTVGLQQHANRHPNQLSGGQRQRVAIARALAAQPRLLLADEPTAALDRETGRQIVGLIQRLAREQGVTVLLVTHDNRILDVADRLLSLEDGKLSSFMSAVTQGTRRLWSLLARDIRHGELVRRVKEIEPDHFIHLFTQVTEETRELVEMIELAQSETFDSMLAQVLEAFALKIGEMVGAERTRLYFVDSDRKELFHLSPSEEKSPLETRVPVSHGIAGRVARLGRRSNVSDLKSDPDFEPAVDLGDLMSVVGVLALPLIDSMGRPFAVIELTQGKDREPFTADDETRLQQMSSSLSRMLESWFRMSCTCRKDHGLAEHHHHHS